MRSGHMRWHQVDTWDWQYKKGLRDSLSGTSPPCVYPLSIWGNSTWSDLPGLSPPHLHTASDHILEVGMWLRIGSYAYKSQLLYRSLHLMGAYLQGFHALTAHRTTFYLPTRTTCSTTVVIGTIVWANLSEPHTSVRDFIAHVLFASHFRHYFARMRHALIKKRLDSWRAEPCAGWRPLMDLPIQWLER